MTRPSTANGGFPNVVVTAVTATTSIAPDIESTWKGLLAGESGIRVLEDDFVDKWDLQVKIGGHLKEPLDPLMTRLEMRRMSYVQRMSKYLGNQLWDTAGTPEVDPDRFSVVIGTGLGGGEKIVEMYDAMNEGGPRKVSPLAVQMVMPNGAAAVVGLELGARAGVITPVSACSSGSEGIAHAWRQIVMGDADIAVCGGVEGVIEALPIAAFSMMRAMSTRNDDPEGGVAAVRQEPRRIRLRRGRRADDHRDRGARQGPRRQAAGQADGCGHLVGRVPHGGARTGRPAGRTRDEACDGDGGAVPQGHQPRQRARHVHVRSVTPPRPTPSGSPVCEHAAVYAPKSALGHSIGAVGALESILTVLALRDGVIPPTLNYETPDPEIDLDVVAGEPRYGEYQYAINNSFGFGGHNVALAFGRY